MPPVDADLNAAARLLTEHLDDGLRRPAEHLDAHGRIERLSVGRLRTLADDLHVRLHRCRVGVDLHNAHLVAGLVYVLVERNQAGFAALDELD